MEKLGQLIQSYLTLRLVVLRVSKDKSIPKQVFIERIKLSEMQYVNRLRKPETWTIDEVITLANELQINADAGRQVKQLAWLITFLPTKQKFHLFKAAQLTTKKFYVRRQNYNNWKIDELQRLAQACHNNFL